MDDDDDEGEDEDEDKDEDVPVGAVVEEVYCDSSQFSWSKATRSGGDW